MHRCNIQAYFKVGCILDGVPPILIFETDGILGPARIKETKM